ncbi:hypothetical protein JQ604_12885 [Bradyrhizobium jicamae]|uniref:hypothetical protein n=1 Tax=Bradyrhizobium jicamae TaxID=280332 RepID=UPI001BA5F764|nr:hypothetical protein [Bradyrhizobium jicamae]MBR0753079.1 hypothetical protein [Bradyrhizobium jicamae]
MSEQATISAEQAKEQPATLPSFKEVLQATKDNFVIVSAAAVLIGVVLAMTFLSSYLWVFDWHLIWFVQYPDIITFGLIAIGVLSGSFAFIQSSVMTLIEAFNLKGRTRIVWIVVLVLLAGALAATSARDAVARGEGYFHIVSGAGALFGAVFLIMILARHVKSARPPNSLQLMFLSFALIGEVAIIGQWVGQTVREKSDFNQDVFVKDQALNDVKIVIVMSRHTVLMKGNVLYVVPTADITKFQSIGKSIK